jgi:hypothetical protein
MAECRHMGDERRPYPPRAGRYDEARGKRVRAYQGRYEIRGSHIDYSDSAGLDGFHAERN